MLVAIIKKELQIDVSLYTLLQILSVSVFEKNQLQQALQGAAYIPEQCDASNQLNSFIFNRTLLICRLIEDPFPDIGGSTSYIGNYSEARKATKSACSRSVSPIEKRVL